AEVTLPAGWSSLGLRVEAGGDGPALRARIEDEAGRPRARPDRPPTGPRPLVGGEGGDRGAGEDSPGEGGRDVDRVIRAARFRASWLRSQGKSADADAAERMAALRSDRLKSAPAAGAEPPPPDGSGGPAFSGRANSGVPQPTDRNRPPGATRPAIRI